MTKVRYVVVKGKPGYCHDKVECAIREDGTQPAKDFLDTLERNAWPKGFIELVDPEIHPVQDFYKLISLLEHLAEFGSPKYTRAINFLEDGIWEVKYSILRMPYFDVDPDGVHEPKNRITVRADVDPTGSDDNWSYPLMDRILRLTHGFPKTGDLTTEFDLDQAFQIREEDLAQ